MARREKKETGKKLKERRESERAIPQYVDI